MLRVFYQTIVIKEGAQWKKNQHTVGARILNIQIPNPFENRTFYCSVLEWFGFRMAVTQVDHKDTLSIIKDRRMDRTFKYLNILNILFKYLNFLKSTTQFKVRRSSAKN